MNKAIAIRLLLPALIVVLALVPIITDDPYYTHILIMICLSIVFAVGLRMILTTGQLSIGHAAFGAIGAYTCTLLVVKADFNFWLALPLAGVVAAIVAVLVGYPTLRIKGAYFAILTFALGELIRLVFVANWGGLTGGNVGIMGIPAPSAIHIGGRVLDFDAGVFGNIRGYYYYLALLLMLIAVWVMHRFDRSRVGMTFRAIAQADLLAECVGINIMRYKVLAFAVACFFAGLAGGILSSYIHYLSPVSLTFHDSIYFIMFAVVGGVGTISGPIIGALLFTALPEALRGAKQWEPIIAASLLLLAVLFLPGGLVSLPQRIKARFEAIRGKEATEHGVA